jgi:hypothetical protein
VQWGPEISTLAPILTQDLAVSVPSALGLPIEAVSPPPLRLPDQVSGASRVVRNLRRSTVCLLVMELLLRLSIVHGVIPVGYSVLLN